MQNSVNVSVQDGLDYAEIKAYLEGFAAGVAAATSAAIEAKFAQVRRREQIASPGVTEESVSAGVPQ